MLDKTGFDLWSKNYDDTVNRSYLNKEYPFDGYFDVFEYILKNIKPKALVVLGLPLRYAQERKINTENLIDRANNKTEILVIQQKNGPTDSFECKLRR